MLSKQINLIFASTLLVCRTLDMSTAPTRVSRNIPSAEHEPFVRANYAELAIPKSAIIQNLSASPSSVCLSNLRNITTASLLWRHRILPGSKFIPFPTLATYAQHSNKTRPMCSRPHRPMEVRQHSTAGWQQNGFGFCRVLSRDEQFVMT
jgi:hypothetical protein